jgi:hypothetical protein
LPWRNIDRSCYLSQIWEVDPKRKTAEWFEPNPKNGHQGRIGVRRKNETRTSTLSTGGLRRVARKSGLEIPLLPHYPALTLSRV